MTEQQILKKFEELGYEILYNFNRYIRLKDKKSFKAFTIRGKKRQYVCHHYQSMMALIITPKEHQLLHELFKCWGWFDEN